MTAADNAWPQLDWESWRETAETLHMYTQIVGKTVLALTPLQNHWWNITFRVTARGLVTPPMPWHGDLFEVEFDFCAHQLHLRLGSGNVKTLQLHAQPVAAFFADYKAALATLGVEAHIWPMPVEVANPIRFDQDHTHTSYDRDAVQRFHRILILADTLLRRFSTCFQGKISPVHFFWGGFDLAVTRFNGKLAAGPPRPDPIQQEAYSHEVISAGFWPGNGGYGAPAFYCYTAPVPAGLAAKPVHPGAWDSTLGEFLLRYDDARTAASPAQAVLDFLASSYAAGAEAAHWDRAALDRPIKTAPASE